MLKAEVDSRDFCHYAATSLLKFKKLKINAKLTIVIIIVLETKKTSKLNRVVNICFVN